MGAQLDAQKATFALITQAAKELQDSGVHIGSKASATRDLAIAYRALAGGPQPGGNVTVEK